MSAPEAEHMDHLTQLVEEHEEIYGLPITVVEKPAFEPMI